MTERYSYVEQANTRFLGPLFYRFCLKLFIALSMYRNDDTAVLYLSRGGLRLRFFFDAFLKANDAAAPCASHDFYVSRMSLIKAGLHDHFEELKADFLKEYAWCSVEGMITAFWGETVFQRWRVLEEELSTDVQLSEAVLVDLLWAEKPSSSLLRNELELQAALYKRYLNTVVRDSKRVVIVDTGWSGSILRYMQLLDPAREYTGLFYGRYSYDRAAPPWFGQLVGLEAEGERVTTRRPETAIFINRHLIEGACEIRWPSVTGYVQRDDDVRPEQGFAPESAIAPDQHEPHARAILNYIAAARDGLNPAAVQRSANAAMKALRRRLMYPRRRDVECFSHMSRSADFGKDLDVPYFQPPAASFWALAAKYRNIRRSLWKSGQIVLEFPVCHPLINYLYHRRHLALAAMRRLGLTVPPGV